MIRFRFSTILPSVGGALTGKAVAAAIVEALVFGPLLIAQRKPSFQPSPPTKKATVQGEKIPEDRFGIGDDEVFDAMHYDQPCGRRCITPQSPGRSGTPPG